MRAVCPASDEVIEPPSAAGARIASRGLGPLGTALAVGYGAKKLYDWNRSRKTNPRFPSEATPSQRSARTHGV